MRKNSSEFLSSFTSEAGTFMNNKDFYAYVELDDVACYIAADGIDSDEVLKSAEIAANSIFESIMENPSMSRNKLKKYIINAHKLLNDESRSVRLKASIAVVITDYSKMIWAISGNARVYHFRKGEFLFRSKDQSVAQMILDEGKITEDEINQHDERNNLTNYLGQPKGFEPFVSKVKKLNDDDAIVLCTSGFWEKISNIDFVDAFRDMKEPSEIVEYLEEILLSRQSKVINNYTLSVIYTKKVFKEEQKDIKKNRILKRFIKILIPVLIIGAIATIYKRNEQIKAVNAISESIEEGEEHFRRGDIQKALDKFTEASRNARKINDKELRDEINKKKTITELIYEGDNLLSQKNFEAALKSFENAEDEIKFYHSYDKIILEDAVVKKVRDIRRIIEAQQLIEKGDEKVQEAKDMIAKDSERALEIFGDALDRYKLARGFAAEVSYNEMRRDLDQKIKDTEDLKNRVLGDIEEIKKAEELEKDADGQMSQQKYSLAIIDYELALNLYKKLKEEKGYDFLEKERDIRRKITQAQEIIEESRNIEESKNNEE
ncbi:UNVERIFIED_CONTAM: serine/threonine protein phosphatase PrpC [Acetivibrio alkalicellulosi]